jgi:uncharacterized protein
MIGPILLAATWLLLRLEGKGLSAIGIDHGARRLAEFAAGFTLLGLAAAAQQLGLAAATNDPFVLNEGVRPAALLEGARFVVNSVLYEELLFRGYLLYTAVRWFGSSWAVWLDAVAFGVYHWFSYGAFGNPIAMAYIFVLTGAYGLMWARAFVATGSVAAPIGLHLGWNAVTYLVFSAGPLGAALLVPASGVHQLHATGWAAVALSIAWPLAATGGVLWLCRRYERRRHLRHALPMSGSSAA